MQDSGFLNAGKSEEDSGFYKPTAQRPKNPGSPATTSTQELKSSIALMEFGLEEFVSLSECGKKEKCRRPRVEKCRLRFA